MARPPSSALTKTPCDSSKLAFWVLVATLSLPVRRSISSIIRMVESAN